MAKLIYIYDPALANEYGVTPNWNVLDANFVKDDIYEGSYIKRTYTYNQIMKSFMIAEQPALIKVLEADISDVESYGGMFRDNPNLEEVNLLELSFDNRLDDYTSKMFSNCPKLKKVKVADVQNAEDIKLLIDFIDKESGASDVEIVVNPTISYLCNDGLICRIAYEIEPGLPKYENYYYFGNYISVDNFINKGNYPKGENGYFSIGEEIYLLEDENIYLIEGKFLGTFTSLEDITEMGFVDMYGDLYYRGEDPSRAKVRGLKYGGKYYHAVTIEGWEEICTSLNELKNANDGKLDNTIIDADHSYTSYFLDEKFEQLIKDAELYVGEKQKEKITVSYVDQCPTFTKMKLNEMYIVPEFDNENEIAYFNRYMKINNNGTEELWDMGQIGHFQEDYYTKERSNETFLLTNSIAYLNNLGVVSDTIYRTLTGTRSVNKRTVATTINKNTDYDIHQLTTANEIAKGVLKRRVLNGMHEIVVEVEILKEEAISNMQLLIDEPIELPMQAISSLTGPVMNFKPKLAIHNPTTGSVSLPAANVAGVLINSLNLMLYTMNDAGYPVGTKFYGYLVYPVWGKDVF